MSMLCHLSRVYRFERGSAAHRKCRKHMRLPWKLFDLENTVDNRKSKCGQSPNTGKPRMRRFMPCERGEQCSGAPRVCPSGVTPVWGIRQSTEA